MKKNIAISALTVLALMGVGSAYGDSVQKPTRGQGANDAGGGCSCPNPVNFYQLKNSGKTNGLQSDYPGNFEANQMTYNDPRVDAHFTDTISWDLPKGTCQFTKATVTWKVKNMAANGIQDNDSTGLWVKGKQLPGSGYTIPLAPGAVRDFTYVLNAAQIKDGHVSLAVQDDTAVLEFSVRIEGCCVNPDAQPVLPAGSGRG